MRIFFLSLVLVAGCQTGSEGSVTESEVQGGDKSIIDADSAVDYFFSSLAEADAVGHVLIHHGHGDPVPFGEVLQAAGIKPSNESTGGILVQSANRPFPEHTKWCTEICGHSYHCLRLCEMERAK